MKKYNFITKFIDDFLTREQIFGLGLHSSVDQIKEIFGQETEEDEILYENLCFNYIFFQKSYIIISEGKIRQINIDFRGIPEKIDSSIRALKKLTYEDVVELCKINNILYKRMIDPYLEQLFIVSTNNHAVLVFNENLVLKEIVIASLIAKLEEVSDS
ncbi:hypothetical protein [Deinococcus roseus]|uniref:Uncharacterized protein n=1 Tax=Deinococcus roseus TaxID=392414 RepID=A0ABQ2CYE9_9DEIO|nr:hypothetical protein [Deinococcus roseus]GGJ33174.1 hypothetical protein GCM10008938_19270 [Deinococcus roseus]